jgi:hypothetical protein
MIRTIEQILGMRPMNQKDTAASPMRAAFTQSPDLTPFTALPNRTSLKAGLSTTDLPSCGADVPAAQNPSPPPRRPGRYRRTSRTSRRSGRPGSRNSGSPGLPPRPTANPEQMNHFSWYEAHDWATPYPGETKIYAPNEVPGAYIPPADTD